MVADLSVFELNEGDNHRLKGREHVPLIRRSGAFEP
jgi:hypothetical protein